MNNDLARRAVACKHWQWMPGMCAVNRATGERRVINIDDDCAWGWHVGGLPDLTDPATLGCLLALVREAWGDDRVSSVRNAVYDTRMILMPCEEGGERLIGEHSTEAAALVAALEAAP